MRVHLADARTQLKRCERGYDVIVVDLFHGDGTPDYLVTRDFFSDLKRCLGAGGIAVFNTFADLEHPVAYAHLLATLRAELPHIVLYRPDWPGAAHINSFIVASPAPLPAPQGSHARLRAAAARRRARRRCSRGRRRCTAACCRTEQIVTDARNRALHDIAQGQIIYRARWCRRCRRRSSSTDE